MDKVIDIVVNLSPIVFILLLVSFIIAETEMSFWFSLFLGCSLILFMFIYPILLAQGYGKIVIVSIMQLLFLLFWIFIVWLFFEKRVTRFILIGVYVIESVCNYYTRLKIDGILQLDFVNRVIDFIKKFELINFYIEIIKNEWFQGVSVGVISTVLGGLILNKIIGKKK